MRSRNFNLSLGIAAAIIAGIFFDSVPYIGVLIPYLLGLLLFCNFMKMNFRMKNFFRKELLFYPVFSLCVFPLIVYYMTAGMGEDFRAGLLIITVTPTAIGSPVVAALVNADRELVLSQVILSNFISPLTYPLIIFLYFGKSDVAVDPFGIFRKVFYVVFLPLAISFLIKKFRRFSGRINQVSVIFTPTVFLFLIFTAVSLSSARLKEIPFLQLTKMSLAVFVTAVMFFSVGFVFFRRRNIAKSVALALGHKNTGIAIWITLSNFHSESVLPIILYLVFHHVCNGILMHVPDDAS